MLQNLHRRFVLYSASQNFLAFSEYINFTKISIISFTWAGLFLLQPVKLYCSCFVESNKSSSAIFFGRQKD